MDHKNSNKALAFSLSIFFHAAFVCSAAFLPLYLSQQNSNDVNELEMAIVSEGVAPETGAPALEQIEMPAPAAPAQVIPTAKAEVTVTRTIKPASRPKPKPFLAAPKRVMVAEKAPVIEAQPQEAQQEESQPVIEVGESLNEDGVNTIEQTQEETPAAETAASVSAAAPGAAAAAPTAPQTQAQAQGQAGTGDQPATAAKPQNFLVLKQAAGNRPPSYPRDARAQKAEGKGQLAYYVSKDGKVTDIKVNKSSGVAALDEAALAAFSKYKFVPGQEGHTVHNFEFTLQGPAEQDGLKLRTTYQEKSEPSRPASLR